MKKILVIPYWVHEQLNRNNLRLADVLDYSKVRKVLSATDMSALLAECDKLEPLIGPCEQPCYEGDTPESLHNLWCKTRGVDDVDDLNRITNLSYDLSVQSDWRTRLFDPASYDERYPEAFNTYDLAPGVVAVVVYPGHFTAEQPHQDKSILLIESILRVFYAYESHHEVARHPCFKQYLRLLQPRSVIV